VSWPRCGGLGLVDDISLISSGHPFLAAQGRIGHSHIMAAVLLKVDEVLHEPVRVPRANSPYSFNGL
jgi:hypothetical protein